MICYVHYEILSCLEYLLNLFKQFVASLLMDNNSQKRVARYLKYAVDLSLTLKDVFFDTNQLRTHYSDFKVRAKMKKFGTLRFD